MRRGVMGTALALALAVSPVAVVTTTSQAGAVGTGIANAGAAAGKRPNMLVVFTDDMRLDDMRFMPRTRRLIGGSRGTTYRRALSENPLCCPMRSTLLTAQYSHNHGVLTNEGDDGGFRALDEDRTVNLALQQSGYRTGYVGKFLNGYPRFAPSPEHVPRGWTEWHSPTRGHYAPRWKQMNHGGRLSRQAGYADDYYGNLASRMIGRLASGPDPFLAVVSYLAPHAMTIDGSWRPPLPPRRYRGSLKGKMGPMPGAFDERDVSDKPAHVRALDRLSQRSTDRMHRSRRLRAEALRAVDDAIAKNLRAVRRSGELGNTIVAFTSDNGVLLGQHRLREQKQVPYEESIRVPMMIRGPGFGAGARPDALVGTVDLGSTLAHAGGVAGRLPHPVDGRDLRDLRPGTGRILLETGSSVMRGVSRPVGEDGETRSYVGVRTNRYMYARYWNGEEELYDLSRDPHQRRSRHGDPGYAATLERLRADTQRLKDCAGTDECR